MVEAKPVTESLAAHIWNRQLLRDDLKTTAGQALQLVFRGRWSFNNGPDFQGAMLILDHGALIKGDVEVHLRSSDWRAHGHHLDPKYNSVALHVVLWNNDEQPARRQDGKDLPALILSDFLRGTIDDINQQVPANLGAIFEEICQANSQEIEASRLGDILDWAGDERFREKSARFEAGLTCEEAEQLLYEGFMEALGYHRNREPFRRLATRTPVGALLALARGRPAEERTLLLESLLFGLAGLLPSQRKEMGLTDWTKASYVEELERLWGLISPNWVFATLNAADWCFSAIRPLNSPARRIAAAARLLALTLDSGLVAGLLASFVSGRPEEISNRLTASLQVSAGDSFWAEHFDFDKPISPGRADLVGKGRAQEMALNIAVPFAHAYGEHTSDSALRQKAQVAYRRFPKLAENQISRQMAQLLPSGAVKGLILTARRQQGLLHLYHTFCAGRRCYECPLGGDIVPRVFSPVDHVGQTSEAR